MHARNEEFLHASRITRPRVWTGLLLNESYKVGSLVEQGAATELYDGTEVSTGEPVALKILLPQLAEDARTRALFLDEARALRRLSQPGLLRYRACARDPQSDLIYIVTDVVGMRLSSRLANRKPSEEDIVSLTRRLALALAAAHGAGVIHRGLRPHALALPQGRLSDATITDFNLIKSAHSGLNAAFDVAMVDHDYCAPEQLSNSGEGAVVGPWTDVYSLALVILSALGGRQSEAERKAKPDLSLLPRKLRPVFERMLEPKPALRLQTMDEVVKQLDLALGSAPLRSLLNRAQSVDLRRFGRAAARETLPPPARPFTAPPAREAQPAPPPRPTVTAPVRPSLPPLPESLRPAKTVPLAKFHEARASIGLGGVARRAAVALSALLLAATPWIMQTSVPDGPAEATTVAPAPVQTASKAPAAPPQGRVYGADNANSRITLRFHRPTRVTVHTRGERLLFSRAVQRGDLYRAPSLADLRVSTEDAGAVEVLFNGTSAGFVGAAGAAVEKASLARFASVAQRPVAPATQKSAPLPAPAPATTINAPEIAIELVPPAAEVTEAAPVQAPEQAVAAPGVPMPDLVAPAIASEVAQPLSPPEPVVVTEAAPEPAPAVQEPPAPPVAIVETPALAEPEGRRRPVLDFLLPWRRPADPIVQPDAVILAPAITKQAAERAKAAADQAKAARDAALEKARTAARARDNSFFNSALGVSSPY